MVGTGEAQKHEGPPTSPGGGPLTLVRGRYQLAAGGQEPDHHGRQQGVANERCTIMVVAVSPSLVKTPRLAASAHNPRGLLRLAGDRGIE